MFQEVLKKLSLWRENAICALAIFWEVAGPGSIVAIILILGVAAIIWGAAASIEDTRAAREAFMEACQQDHKEYECLYMWSSIQNANSSDSSDIMAAAAIGIAAGTAAGRR